MSNPSFQKSWESIWSYCQLDYRSWPSKIISDHQKITIKLNQVAKEIRLRFSNQYGRQTLSFTKVTVTVKGKKQTVTVNQSTAIDILAGANLISDPLQLSLAEGDTLTIETYLENPVELTGGIVTYSKECNLSMG